MFTWYWLHTMRANDVRPYGLFGRVCCAAKSLRSLRIYVVLRDRKAVQVYASMLVLFDVWVLCAFWICSAPLSRLTPIEALPQTPLGALPPDPHNGFHPLTLTRGVPLDLLLASLGVLFYSILVICSVSYAHSSLLIPHSSFILALSAIHRCYLRQSLRQSIIKLIKAFQSPLPVCSHC